MSLNKLSSYFSENRKKLFFSCLLSTVVCAMAAHGFLFTNEFFSHDSASGFAYAPNVINSFYIGIGRFLIPCYDLVKGCAAAPWLIGILFIIWMSLSSFFICEILEIKGSVLPCLASGILCTNMALTLTGATYVYCLDDYALALFTAVLALYFFKKDGWASLLGVIFLVISLALYQPYFSVTLSLAFLCVIKSFASGNHAGKTVLEGLKYIALSLLSFLVYYGVWTIITVRLSIVKERVDESLLSGGIRSILTSVETANSAFWDFLFNKRGELGYLLPAVHVLILLFIIAAVIARLCDKKVPVLNRVLFAVLVILIPTVFESAYIMMPGNSHGLTTFVQEFIYITAILCIPRFFPEKPAFTAVVSGCLCLVIWQHTAAANQIYLKKELEKNNTLALANRVIDRIEETEGYVPGSTPVSFIGALNQNEYFSKGWTSFDSYEHMNFLTNIWNSYAATYNLDAYIYYYMNYPLYIRPASDFASSKEVQKMPIYPNKGSVKMVDGSVVVKLS